MKAGGKTVTVVINGIVATAGVVRVAAIATTTAAPGLKARAAPIPASKAKAIKVASGAVGVAAVAVGVAFTFAWLRPASESAGVASGQPPAAQSPSGVPKVEKTAGSNAADPFSQALALAEAGNLAAAGVVVAELKATLNDAGVSALRLRIEGSPKLRPILARTEWQSTGVFQMDAGVKPPPAPLEPMSLQPRLAPSLAPSLARDPRVLRQPASPPAATSSEKLDVPEF